MALPLNHQMRVDLAYSGVWNDITTDVYNRDDVGSITIKRGASSEDEDYQFGHADLSLKNTTGKYSPRNAMSPLYGLIGRANQLRIGLGRPAIGLGRAQAGTSGTSFALASITAEASGMEFVAYAGTAGNFTLPAGFTAAGTEDDSGSWTFSAGYQNSVAAGATGIRTATLSGGTQGASGIHIHIPGATFVSGLDTYNTLGADVTFNNTLVGGRTLLATCSWDSDTDDRMQPPRIAANDIGLGWYLIADSGVTSFTFLGFEIPSTRTQVWAWNVPDELSGVVSINFLGKRDGTGTAWMNITQVSGANIYIPRFVGEVSEWPVEWDKSGADVATPITASGIGRRLSTTNYPQNSSIKDALLTYAVPLNGLKSSAGQMLGYWPLEDGSGSTTFASALDGGTPMTFTGVPSLGSSASLSDNPATEPLPTFTAAGASAPIASTAQGTNPSILTVGCLVRIGAAGTAVGANIFSVSLSGTLTRVTCEWRSNTLLRFKLSGTDVDLSVSAGVNGRWFLVGAYVLPNGTGTDYTVFAAPCSPGITNVQAFDTATGTVATTAIGRATSMSVGLETNTGLATHTNAPVFGHVWVATRAPIRFDGGTGDQLAPNSGQAWVAWVGQKASDRMHLVASSHGAKIQVQHNDTEQKMGVLMVDTPTQQLSDAEQVAVGGNLFDSAGYLGLRHRGRVAQENQDTRTFLDYTDEVVYDVQVTDDDLYLANDVTVVRTGGSSARAIKVTGALSIKKPPLGVGPYPKSLEKQLYLDTQTTDQAGYALARGTVDTARVPMLSYELTNPNNDNVLNEEILFLDIGSHVAVGALPVWAPAENEVFELLVQGYTESFSNHQWFITLVCTPFGAAATAWLDDAGSGSESYDVGDRIGDDANLTLNEALDTTETGVDYTAATPGANITTAAADFNFPIVIDGEEMIVTGNAAGTLTVIRSTNGVVKTHATGAAITITQIHYLPLDS